MSITISGLHHVTAMAGRAQAAIEYYVRLLGLRLVKRTVNFDDPQTYHFYFGDQLGRPGSVVTFFPWLGAGPAVRGAGEATALALRVPPGALDAWRARLDEHGVSHATTERFGAEVVAFTDPDGTPLELVEGAGGEPETWPGAPLPASQAVQGLHAATLLAPELDATAALLERLGLARAAEERDEAGTHAGRRRVRFADGDGLTHLDLLEAPERAPGRWGTGSIHHVALRAADDDALAAARELLAELELNPTKAKDRHYFRSVYFQEPGGAVLEIATDGPGFTVDEPADELGLGFRLPPWLEGERDFLRGRLPVTASPEYADRFSRR